MAAGLAAFVGLVAVGWLAVTTLRLLIELHDPNTDPSVRRVALAAGLSGFAGSVLEAFATANGPYDAGQLSESARRGYANAAAYWMGEGLATSLLLLLLIPLCTVVFGAAGAMIGKIGRPGSASQSVPSAPVQ